MLFPTPEFAVFFAIVFVVAWAARPRRHVWKVVLLVASYVFYAWWDPRFTLLLAAATVAAQSGALAVARARSERARRTALAATVAFDLGLLGWFKYYGFFSLEADRALAALGLPPALPLLQVTLPVAISFFTFMGISYVVDVFRRDTAPASWLDAAVYLAFFPHLVAGPIVRAGELIPQIRRPPAAAIDASRASLLIVGGLFKKVVLSSVLATGIVDPVFGAPGRHSSLEVLVAVYGYAVQIYADFSGYTDIAIGLALLLGVRFPENFAAPYGATSLQEFWRRWHMTLCRWLRDYLYIPLGGSRRGARRAAVNVFLTMALGGLWHGAAWTFVIWGAIHGGWLAAERRWRTSAPPLPGRSGAVAGWLVTFHLVCFAWIFFRAGTLDVALELITRLVGAPGPAPLVTPTVVAAIAAGLLPQLVRLPSSGTWRARLAAAPALGQGLALGAALVLITALGPKGVAPFIYYRF